MQHDDSLADGYPHGTYAARPWRASRSSSAAAVTVHPLPTVCFAGTSSPARAQRCGKSASLTCVSATFCSGRRCFLSAVSPGTFPLLAELATRCER